ncbi:hypothetical protein L195_g024792 [Trifolium pratense]|uniref:Uncharacterized protein n=1 Tax=Trifolium pratense TaxID=57577 RepID=A0A2K3NEN5_TRIPR|nr:hypothetical protein L195_g024792 [Trifolium pratense]
MSKFGLLGRGTLTTQTAVIKYAESVDAPTKIISLAEHNGTGIFDHIPETANRLSEDMVKCISPIYYKLAEPPVTNPGLPSPSTSTRFMEFSGPYSTIVEVSWIYNENQKLSDTVHLLQTYRSLICQLEEVGPGNLKHEKLAF